MGPTLSVHPRRYVEFLRTAWSRWKEAGFECEAIPMTWPARRMGDKPPRNIDGLLGYDALSADTSQTETTWEAAHASALVALSGAERLPDGANAAFALCRPPGHHAAADMYRRLLFPEQRGDSGAEPARTGRAPRGDSGYRFSPRRPP